MSDDDLLATMDGLGTVEVPRVPASEVAYTIRVFAPAADQVRSSDTPPFVTRVQLRARVADLFHWYTEHRTDVVLVLDDGRRVPLTLLTADGDAVGHGLL